METLLFALYILMWPAASAVVLVVIVVAFVRDLLAARREGQAREMV